MLLDRERPAEALELLERAVAISAASPRSTTHVITLNGLGDALRLAGRLDEAERLHRERLELSRQMFGRDHPMAIRAEADLARVDLARGDFAAAELTFRRALAVYREILEPEHPRIAEFELDLGHALIGLTREAEGEPLVRRAATVLEDVYGAEDPRVQLAHRLLVSGVAAETAATASEDGAPGV